MKIQSITTKYSASNKQSFNGIKALPKIAIKNAGDAISQWQKLADRSYTLLGSTKAEEATNFMVRKENFSFLDKLTSNDDKFTFVEEFKRVTGFPDLTEVSSRIKTHFSKILSDTQTYMKKVRPPMPNGREFNIAVAGFNPISSIGLDKALPGSNINDAFVVYNTDYPLIYPTMKNIRQAFLEKLQNSADHRIFSFNHKHSRPIVMDLQEYQSMVGDMDRVVEPKLSKYYNALLGKRMGYVPFNPEAIDGSNPSFLNLFLSAHLNPDIRVVGHDTAIVTEGIRDGIRVITNDEFMPDICQKMNKSFFSWCTNMLQIHSLEQVIGTSEAPYRAKLVAREALKDFNKWPIKKQYDCVKAVVKNISDNNEVSSEFAGMLKDRDQTLEHSLDILRSAILNG